MIQRQEKPATTRLKSRGMSISRGCHGHLTIPIEGYMSLKKMVLLLAPFE